MLHPVACQRAWKLHTVYVEMGMQYPKKPWMWNSDSLIVVGRKIPSSRPSSVTGQAACVSELMVCVFCASSGTLLSRDHSVKLSVSADSGSPVVVDVYITATCLQHLRGLLPGAKIHFQNLERKISRCSCL